MNFETYFKENQNLLFRIVYSYVRKRDIAEDITVETFMKVHERWDKVNTFDNPVGYLVRIGINMAKKHLLKNKFSWGVLHEDMKSDDIDPETWSLLAETNQQLEQALMALKDEERTIVLYKDLEEMKFQEIADILDMKLPTVKSLYRRAKLKLIQETEVSYA